ncbi:urea transporter [Staphylococcus delphini]|uniref:urea transporter n=1 Tax=Staphylococcus delphini TaxID=53344 RepID=UPI0021D2D3C3|nr:urea transporter [Staphylococcus delphini]
MSKWIHTFFKNISQVVLLENTWTGLLILIALWIGNWKIGLAAMIGSVISLLTARFFNYTDEEIHSGLAGFNPVLIAIDLTLFLLWSWQSILVILNQYCISDAYCTSHQKLFKTIPSTRTHYTFCHYHMGRSLDVTTVQFC